MSVKQKLGGITTCNEEGPLMGDLSDQSSRRVNLWKGQQHGVRRQSADYLKEVKKQKYSKMEIEQEQGFTQQGKLKYHIQILNNLGPDFSNYFVLNKTRQEKGSPFPCNQNFATFLKKIMSFFLFLFSLFKGIICITCKYQTVTTKFIKETSSLSKCLIFTRSET